MDNIREMIGKNIREARKRQHMTLDELSAKADVRVESITRYEHNRAAPNAVTLYHIAKALNVSADTLLGLN